MNVTDVHKKINSMAKEQGLTLYELARRSGMTYTVLYNMMTRKTMPKIDTLSKICKGLDISLSEFFSDDKRPKPDGFLTTQEIDLIEINRELNKSGKERLLVYATGLRDSQKSNKK